MDVKEFAKDNWPILVGGAIGLYIIFRPKQTASYNAPVIVGGSSDAAIMASAQAEALRQQAALQNRQMDLTTQQYADDLALKNRQLDLTAQQASDQLTLANRELELLSKSQSHELALQRAALELQAQSNSEAARVATITAAGNFLGEQGQSAAYAASAVSQVVAALNAPSISAMESAAIENAYALNAAATAAVVGFATQAEALGTYSNTMGQYFSGANSIVNNAPIYQNGPSTSQGIANVMTGAGSLLGGIGKIL